MNARDFMESVLKAVQEIKLMNARRASYLEMATGSGIGNGMPHNPNVYSKVENAAVGMADLVTQLDVKMSECAALIKQAEDLIEKLPQYKFRQVLTYKYIVGIEKWSEIGEKMGYKDEKSASRVNGYALKELQQFM